jgi:hypothetical protein
MLLLSTTAVEEVFVIWGREGEHPILLSTTSGSREMPLIHVWRSPTMGIAEG